MPGDEITLTLNSPITDEQFNMLTDVDMENTTRVFFHTKNGKEVEFTKIVRCENCEHFSKFDSYERFVTGIDGVCGIYHETRTLDWFCPDGVKEDK